MKEQIQTFTPASAYQKLNLERADDGDHDGAKLYLDLIKRAVCNLIYEDIAIWKYDQRKVMEPLNHFDLEARFLGEDLPTEAHTMVGWRRLTNLEKCAETVFAQKIPGDFVETGVLRGGSSIFMRALLKAYKSNDRKVYACDTFVFDAQPSDRISRLITRVMCGFLKVAVKIPSQSWRLKLFRFFEKNQKSFPKSENPSRDWIECFLYTAANWDRVSKLAYKDRTSLAAVQSHFARYGLLDEQVVFLKGFFSDTLPQADIKSIALLRCDGDSFESTYGVLRDLYAKVSPGGFVIIDDYHSFSDCQDAVDRFRQEQKITAPILPIDNLAVYWQRPNVNE
jgi:O-methyltransferase